MSNAINDNDAGIGLRRRTGAADRARAVALDAYGILDTPPERAFDDIASHAAAVCRTSIAAVTLLCPSRQWHKATVGLDVSEVPIEHSFCAHAIARGGPELFEVRDASADPRFAANPLVSGPPNLRFYAGMPLITAQGVGLGALCVVDDTPRPGGLTPLEARTLRLLADQVVTQLELRRVTALQDLYVARHGTATKELDWVANHDPLTGLANRTLFGVKLQEAITGGARAALLMLDLDHFKQVNDQLGTDAGDGMLKAFAQRMRSLVRATDTVARIGGDEFAIILPTLNAADDVAGITASFLARLAEPLVYDGRIVECRATIGVAIYPDHARTADDLVRDADIALAAAKGAGRGRMALFGDEMLATHQRRGAMIACARTALDNGWIVPFYQPKVDLANGAVTGFEALLRVRRPDGEIGPPSMIAAAFEDPDLAIRLGEAMIRQVAADMRRWQDAGVAFGRIAVNASAAEFRDDELAERLLGELARVGVPPERLELEVTETVFLDHGADVVERALHCLSEAGVRIALDDFGTGYASLSHLRRFPVDVLKIDQSFVRGLHETERDGAIVSALLNLGANLGIETIAEGIETEAQAAYLRRHGCKGGQGYLFDKALPADRVPAAIAARATHASAARGVSADAALRQASGLRAG